MSISGDRSGKLDLTVEEFNDVSNHFGRLLEPGVSRPALNWKKDGWLGAGCRSI